MNPGIYFFSIFIGVVLGAGVLPRIIGRQEFLPEKIEKVIIVVSLVALLFIGWLYFFTWKNPSSE